MAPELTELWQLTYLGILLIRYYLLDYYTMMHHNVIEQ